MEEESSQVEMRKNFALKSWLEVWLCIDCQCFCPLLPLLLTVPDKKLFS